MFHYINTRLPLTFILAALFLVSCSDEINEKKQTQHESTCGLSQFVKVSSGLRDTSKFEYDADGNLTVYTLIEDRESFTYNLNYNKNNEIEEIRNAKDGDIFQFFYSGNNISQMVSSYNFSNSASNVTEFDYNEVGQVIQIKEYAFDEITNEKYLIERINYSWNRNNIASCTMLYGDSLNEKTVISFLNFDNFDNPFYNLPLWYLEFNRPNYLCKNNVKQVAILNGEDSTQLIFDLEYDEKDRVVKFDFQDLNKEPNKWLFEYKSCN